MNKLKRGFTFLEIIVALAIIGVLASILMPSFKRFAPGYQRKQFIDYMNSLMQMTRHNAVVTNKLHKVNFDLEKRRVWIEVEGDKKSNLKNEVKFVPVKENYVKTSYIWPENSLEIKNFFIAKRDEVSLTLKGKEGKLWFFITPEGIAQPVIINAYDLKEPIQGAIGAEFSLVLNPFTLQFREYDAFQKPE